MPKQTTTIKETEPAAKITGWPDLLNDVINQFNTLRTEYNTLVAKLNADAGVTDTNYAVTTSTAVTPLDT